MSNIKKGLRKVVETDSQWSSVFLRVPAGIIFAAHGAQKLFAWFGGYGLEGTGQFMVSQGLEPGFLMALLVGGVEFFGGLALILGLFIRPAAVALAFAMLVAIIVVHLAGGLFLDKGGFEYALALLSMSMAIFVLGGGRYSIDRLLMNHFQRTST